MKPALRSGNGTSPAPQVPGAAHLLDMIPGPARVLYSAAAAASFFIYLFGCAGS